MVFVVRSISSGVVTTGSTRFLRTIRMSSSNCAFKGSVTAMTIVPLRSSMGTKL